MSALKLFLPIVKIDVAKRLVYGIATAEKMDRSGEICDYTTTKPYYQKWSGDIEKTTDGKSLGNIRAMHGKVAAGKVTSIAFNDEAKQIEICSKIVDDGEWNKVQEGVYTGFSHGGAYVKRWTDSDGNQRYTADPSEISIVDLPCLPEATFSVIKADGMAEDHHFKTVIVEPTNDQVLAKARELATAAGDASNWPVHLDPAREGLRKAALKIEPPAAADPPVPEVSKTAPAVETPVNGSEWEQVWKSKRDGATFKTKDELRKHHEDLDAAAATDGVTKGALDALDAIANVLDTDSRDGFEKKDWSDEERMKAAAAGEAMPGGEYPIRTKADLKNAVQAFGSAKDPEATKTHIIGRAKSLGATDLLPSSWPGSTAKDDKSPAEGKGVTDGLGKATPDKETVKTPKSGTAPTDLASQIDPEKPSDAASKHSQMSIAHRSVANDFTKDAKGYAADGNTKMSAQMRDHARAHDDAADMHDRAAKMFTEGHQDAEKCMKEAFAASDTANMKTGTALKGSGRKGLFKGLPTCARLCDVIESLKWIEASVHMEAKQEGDKSPVVAQVQENVKALCDTLVAMVAEETSELIQGQNVDDLNNVPDVFGIFGYAAGVPVDHASALVKFMKGRPELAKAGAFIEKVGARHSVGDKKKIQDMHDTSVGLGAECTAGGKASHDHGLAKIAEDLSKVTAERDALKKAIDEKIMPKLTMISAQVKKLSGAPRPIPFKPGTHVVDKTADGVFNPPAGDAESTIEEMVKTEEGRNRLSTLMIKASQASGGQPIGYRHT